MSQRLNCIFSEIFHLPEKKINENMSSINTERWESLNHLKLIMAIEREFNIQFETELIPKLNSYKIIKAAIGKVVGK